MKGCKLPCHSIIYSLLAALSLLGGIASANDGAIPFDATYDVYRNGANIGEANFRLQQQNGSWIWDMRTQPRGIYRWLTRKKPFTETRMIPTDQGLRLSQISNGDYPEQPPKNSAWFDHDNQAILYSKADGGEPQKLDLPPQIFSFHSVHLLYAQMKASGQQSIEIDFYRKGQIYKSTLTLQRDVAMPMSSGETLVDKMAQQLEGSDRAMAYYYHGHEVAPVLIEQIKKGEVANAMKRTAIR